jgi:hypothetical protein
MIRSKLTKGASGVEFDIPRGTGAFVDLDWIPAEPEREVPGLSIDADSITWRGTSLDRAGEDAGRAAEAIFGRAAQAVATAASRDASGPALVFGCGAIAAGAAHALGVEPTVVLPEKDRSLAVAVDLSGDPEAMTALAGALQGLGRLVLAGERLGRKLPLNLYPDIHVRGLTVTGIDPIAVALDDAAGVVAEVPAPTQVGADGELPAGARLLRIDG